MSPSSHRTPADEAALAQIVIDATATRQPICITGSSTKQHFGRHTPSAQKVSMQSFDKITEHPPGDLVVTAQAGVRLADLQAVLARHNQWLPVDPPFSNTTVGGMLATGLSGPRRLGHGQIKDQLLGMRVVGATGVATDSGGKVVKNVTGFDLHRLHTGAMGTLGVIVSAHFKIATRPEHSRILIARSNESDRLHRFLLRIHRTKLQPTALELHAGASLTRSTDAVGGASTSQAMACVGVAGNPASVARHEADLSQLLREESLDGEWLDGADAELGWKTASQLPQRWQQRIVLRLGALPESMSARISDAIQDDGVECAVSAGSNTARIALPEGSSVGFARAFVSKIMGPELRRTDYCVVESAPIALAGRESLPWLAESPHLDSQAQLFRAVKRSFDPAGIFNPGKEPF